MCNPMLFLTEKFKLILTFLKIFVYPLNSQLCTSNYFDLSATARRQSIVPCG